MRDNLSVGEEGQRETVKYSRTTKQILSKWRTVCVFVIQVFDLVVLSVNMT